MKNKNSSKEITKRRFVLMVCGLVLTIALGGLQNIGELNSSKSNLGRKSNGYGV